MSAKGKRIRVPTSVSVKKLGYEGQVKDVELMSSAELLGKLQSRMRVELVEAAPTDTDIALVERLAELERTFSALRRLGGATTSKQSAVRAAAMAAPIYEKYKLLKREGKTKPRDLIGKTTAWAQLQPQYSAWSERQVRRAVARMKKEDKS